MRKRNLDYFFNSLFWFFALILPGVIWLILQCRSSVPISIETLLSGSSVESFAGILYEPLDGFFEILGVSYRAPFVGVCAYMIIVELSRIALDILLFIPKLCHQWFENIFGGNSLWK